MVIYGMKGKGTPLKLQREVKPFGAAAHILVPKSWIGWEVQVKVLRPKGMVKRQVDLETRRLRIRIRDLAHQSSQTSWW
jgi:hypothetical protein